MCLNTTQLRPRTQTRSGFTLPELLVVMGIIILLLAVLLPTLIRAREMSCRAVCLSNIRQLTAAWMMYANDNKGWLCNSTGNPEWLLYDPKGPTDMMTTPAANDPLPLIPKGQLWPYLKSRTAYVCPSDPQSLRNTASYPPPVYVPGGTGTSYTLNVLLGATTTASNFEAATGPGAFVSPAKTLGQIRSSASRMVFFEGNDGWVGYGDRTFFIWYTEINSFHASTAGSIGGNTVSFADGHAIFWQLSRWGDEQRVWFPINGYDGGQFDAWLTGLSLPAGRGQ